MTIFGKVTMPRHLKGHTLPIYLRWQNQRVELGGSPQIHFYPFGHSSISVVRVPSPMHLPFGSFSGSATRYEFSITTRQLARS